jgi:hypothetical protein
VYVYACAFVRKWLSIWHFPVILVQ